MENKRMHPTPYGVGDPKRYPGKRSIGFSKETTAKSGALGFASSLKAPTDSSLHLLQSPLTYN